MQYQTQVVVIGAGIAGLVTALELARAGKQVLVVDRESAKRVGGLARTAFGGMALVGTREQKRMGVPDTPAIAYDDWCGFAEFEPDEVWPKAWAKAYTENCRTQVYDWLQALGMSFMPAVNWVERGQYGVGNSLPRYHVLWGTGLGLVQTILAKLSEYSQFVSFLQEHRVDALHTRGGSVHACSGINLLTDDAFEIEAEIIVVASGGINGSIENVIKHWPEARSTAAQENLLSGAHPFADGRLHEQLAALGACITHQSDMWNYAAGVSHPKPEFDGHGLSLIPCKSALWLDHTGRRIGPSPLVTGFDTHDLCNQVSRFPQTWQVLNWHIAAHELAVSGAEHNGAIRDHKCVRFLWQLLRGNHALVQRMLDECPDFIVADSLEGLIEKMRDLTPNLPVDGDAVKASVAGFDRALSRAPRLQNDEQIRRVLHARQWRPDRLRTVKPAPISLPKHGPLIAIRCRLISRKSLGGIQTDLNSAVQTVTHECLSGVYAVGEAAGFGGGGASGKRSLEGTFLAGCILTARAAAAHINSIL
ncbi:FAD-binding dehydrogenase [Simiduia litorea]|uniref:FAD-dependent oxidoreductase n=1 Tax=Simiduia litorea TaxID=1435348 RepID=UPI0036F3163B